MAETQPQCAGISRIGDEVDYYTEVTGGDLAEGDMLIYDTTFSIGRGTDIYTGADVF